MVEIQQQPALVGEVPVAEAIGIHKQFGSTLALRGSERFAARRALPWPGWTQRSW